MDKTLINAVKIVAGAIVATAGFGTFLGGSLNETTAAHKATISEIRTLEELPNVQAYNRLSNFGFKDRENYGDISAEVLAKELVQNPDSLQLLEQIVTDPQVVRYVHLKERPTSQFSKKKAIYGALIGGASVPLAYWASYAYVRHLLKEKTKANP